MATVNVKQVGWVRVPTGGGVPDTLDMVKTARSSTKAVAIRVCQHDRALDMRTADTASVVPGKLQGGWIVLRTEFVRPIGTAWVSGYYHPGQALVGHTYASLLPSKAKAKALVARAGAGGWPGIKYQIVQVRA